MSGLTLAVLLLAAAVSGAALAIIEKLTEMEREKEKDVRVILTGEWRDK